MPEAYAEAAIRCYDDGDSLFQGHSYPNASHLFGLSAECALKLLLSRLPGDRELPRRHLPTLRDDVLRTLSRRGHNGVRLLLNGATYMEGWEIANRYWPDAAFTRRQCASYRDHSRRTLYASGVMSGP